MLILRRTDAVFAEGVIKPMREDHEQTPRQRDLDLNPMIWEAVSIESPQKDEPKAETHQVNSRLPPMDAIPIDQSDRTNHRDHDCQTTVCRFFRR